MQQPSNSLVMQARRKAAQVLLEACHHDSREAGWWQDLHTQEILGMYTPRLFPEKIALIHSELSEALEGDRTDAMDKHLPHRTSREVELADAVIRIFDLAGGFGLDLPGAIAEKLAYNSQRADHKVENRKLDGGKAY